MNPRRRKFILQTMAAAASLPASYGFAWAEAYPTRPVRLVVFFPPGGVGDTLGRIMAQWLSIRLGQSFVIENRAGASGTIGTRMVVRAAPDGYTLLWATSPNTINGTLFSHLDYNFIRDIEPVAATFRVPNMMVVTPSLPVRDVPEFIAYAKANPGKVNMVSGGLGSPSHLAGELFSMMAGIKMVHVPYRGSAPAINDLLSGRMQVMFDAMPSSLPYVRAGKLRPLAVTTAARSKVLPDTPTIGEFLPGFEASTWFGIGAPKGTPSSIVDSLNKEVNAGLADEKIKARISALGGMTLPGSPEDFRHLLVEETKKWAKVIKFAGVKAN